MSSKADCRFPAPWRAFKGVGGFGVEDANGTILAWVNFSDGTWKKNSDWLTEKEAEVVAQAFSQLPDLMSDVAEAKRMRPLWLPHSRERDFDQNPDGARLGTSRRHR